MATYTELRNLFDNPVLRGRVETAVVVTANAIAAAVVTETAARKTWANKALLNTEQEARLVLKLALAQNKSASVAQINAVSDSALQTIVENAVALLAG